MFRIIKESEAVIREINENKKAANLITKEISGDLSLAVLEGVNYSEKEISAYSRIYYVLEGKLILNFGEGDHSLAPGDTCFVSRGTGYEMKGAFKAIAVNQPAFGSIIDDK
jgi:ethanolamine utilization protein EutQ (cupin superfamily)